MSAVLQDAMQQRQQQAGDQHDLPPLQKEAFDFSLVKR